MAPAYFYLGCAVVVAAVGLGGWQLRRRHHRLLAADQAVLAQEKNAIAELKRDSQSVEYRVSLLNRELAECERLLEEADEQLLKSPHGFAVPALQSVVHASEENLADCLRRMEPYRAVSLRLHERQAELASRLVDYTNLEDGRSLRTHEARVEASQLLSDVGLTKLSLPCPSECEVARAHGVDAEDVRARARARHVKRQQMRVSGS